VTRQSNVEPRGNPKRITGLVIREGSYVMEQILRELTDTELDAVSGGASASAAAVNVNTSTDTSFAVASVGVAAAAAALHLVPFDTFSVTLIGPGAAAGSA
jgi:hypothetical protein